MDHPGSGFATSPWAAMLGHHAMGPGAEHPGFPHAAAHHGHHGMPMDLHVPQGFPYYRYRDDALCWTDRKPSMDDVGNPTSVNARILELRKEKSRDAARSRRGKENFEFYELAKMLPLPAAITSQLDKASIIRLTISYLKLRDFSGTGDPPWSREQSTSSKVLKGASSRRTPAGLALDLFEQHQGTHILQSLDGFALAVAADGRFLYISETVSIYLGLSQVEMTGSSIFDYIHHSDHAEVAEQFGLSLASAGQGGLASPASGASDEGSGSQGTNNPDVAASMTFNSSSPFKGYERAFCVRMKSTLTKRGCHFKSSGYRVVLMLCRLRAQYTFSHTRKSQPPLLGMVALAIALPPPSVHEIRLESDMFVTRINFDFRIAHCEPKVSDLLDYTAEELTGKNLYALCHAEDGNKLRKCHIDLINKGQVLTHYWRFMNKNGGFTWVQTCATVVCNSKNADEQNIICVNYVISNKEYANMILDCCQLENGLETIKREDPATDNGARSPGGDPSNDGKPGPSANRPTDPQKSPKPETPEPRNRARSHANTGAGTAAAPPTNTTTSNVAIDKGDPALGTPSEDTTTPLLSVPAPRRGQKRKHRTEEVESLPTDPAPTNTVLPIANPADGHRHTEEHSESSVKNLENAMSKHLPTQSTTDFSTDALLKQQQQQQDKGSTIQWIGHHNHHFHQQTSPMPATALLRQLYANRESVIRATTRPAPSGVFYTDSYISDAAQTGPLPTPPGSESSFDNQFLLHGHTGQKPGDAFSNLVSSYGGYPASMDYHNAMTPPSSVSPRDSNSAANKAPPIHPASTGFDYGEALRSQYSATDPAAAPPLPLKPQPYSAAAAMHHAAAANSIEAYGSLDQSQYFPHHTGFHLYHKGAPTAGWYSTPS
ncbi:protein trachealess isoform X1 [Lutzomyia longipalpis]|uniref:protein trachealess isoform X1 n=1 Tax=Lutzomyia longipalpis TaxID=7200 RepID=UPI0024840C89|nr:protein trachealess isoform X1 [Lutzomyia longipalpis]